MRMRRWLAGGCLALTLEAGSIELLGPAGRTIARSQQTERGDGSGQFLELAMFPAPGVTGFSRVQLWTSKRDAGKYTRLRLQEKELQLPEPQRIARELYDFSIANYSNPNAALAENRVAVLCGTTEPTLRVMNLTALTVGRAIALPAQARQVAWRPGSAEIWTAHAGASNQVSISDPVTERVVGSIPLRQNQQAVPVALQFSASGRTAYVVLRLPDGTTDRGLVLVIDPVTRQIRSTVTLGTNSPTSAALSPDGSVLYVAGTSLNDLNTAEPSIVHVDLLTNTVSLAALGLAIAPDQILIHPGGQRIYFTFPSTFGLDEYDVQARRVLRRIALPRLIVPQHLEFTPNGDVMFVRDGLGQQAIHLDVETGEVLDVQAIPAGPGVSLVRP